MQLLVGSSDPNRPTVHDKIGLLLKQGGSSQQFTTVRGKILDRKGRVLASDEARFQLCISYSLCSVLDPNVVRASLARRKRLAESNPTNEDLQKAYEKASLKLGVEATDVYSLVASQA
jgi:cell division protein FtsI/penicillin-binding protein 2